VQALLRIVRAPALHFLLLGACVFALGRDVRVAPPPAERRIVLAATDVARLRREFIDAYGAPPGPAAEARLVDAAVDEEVLYRAALAEGLDRREPAVQARLAQLVRFVGEGGSGEDDGALEREARALGLDRDDLVVRRHLVQLMRLALGRLEPGTQPGPAEVAAYYARHADEFTTPETVRLTHVYVRAGADAGPAAARLLAALRRERVSPADAPARGAPFIAGAEIGPATPAEVTATFGPGFAAALDGVRVGEWGGPLRSTYGLHLVWVHERTPGGPPPLDVVRSRVRQRLLAERREALRRERLRALRASYQITVERPGAGGRS
jgi:peptidyl-prolyl cis-trans isomerase C